jgi:hypothetical protein
MEQTIDALHRVRTYPVACAPSVDPALAFATGVGGRKVLVCEGACNPHLPAIDERLAALRSRSSLNDDDVRHRPTKGEDAMTIAAIRRLIYTPHRFAGGDRWACTTCDHVRRFGDSEGQ